MANLTRDELIKSIVANEMKDIGGVDYSTELKKMYHKWNHVSSSDLCVKYNQIYKTNLSVDILQP